MTSNAAAGADALRTEPCVGIPDPTARCHRLSVHEDQTSRRGRTISLRIVVLPATGAKKPTTRWFISPGVLDRPRLSSWATRRFAVDGRARASRCRLCRPARHRRLAFASLRLLRSARPSAELLRRVLPIEKVESCRRRWSATLTLRSTRPAPRSRISKASGRARLPAADARRRLIRHAAGDGYVRRYEPHVRAVILDGPVTPANHVPEHFGQLAATALDGVLAECLADEPCARAFPHIREEAREVFDRLRAVPAKSDRGAPVGASAGRGDADAQPRRRGDPISLVLDRRRVTRAALPPRGFRRRLLFDRQLPDALARPMARSMGCICRSRAPKTCRLSVRAPPSGRADFSWRLPRAPAACGMRRVAARDEVSLESTPRSPRVCRCSFSRAHLDPVTPPENGDVLARTLTREPASARAAPAGMHSTVCHGLDCLGKPASVTSSSAGNGRRLDTSCVQRHRARRFCDRASDIPRPVGSRALRHCRSPSKLFRTMVILSFDNIAKRYGDNAGASRRVFRRPRRRNLRPARSERRRQEHAHPDPDGHHPRRLGRGAGLWRAPASRASRSTRLPAGRARPLHEADGHRRDDLLRRAEGSEPRRGAEPIGDVARTRRTAACRDAGRSIGSAKACRRRSRLRPCC